MQYLFLLKHEDIAKPLTTKLVTLLFKDLRLSQACLGLSSSRGVLGSKENERNKREKRAKYNLKTKAAGKAWIKVSYGYKVIRWLI